MQKLKYTIFDALVNFYRRRRVNFIVSLSFSLGLLLPMLCLGNINIFVENLSTMRLKNDSDVWIAYPPDEHISDGKTYYQFKKTLLEESPLKEVPLKISSPFQDSPLEITDYAISAYMGGAVGTGGTKDNIFICYLTKDWDKFENCKIIDGSLDMFSGTDVCLVEQTLAEKYSGLHAGDKIMLSGVTYTINGIFSSFNYYNKILLPLDISGQTAESDIVISKLYLRIKGTSKKTLRADEDIAGASRKPLPTDEAITAALKNIGLPVSHVQNAAILYHATLKEGLYRSLAILGVGFIAFAFAAINICLVLIGKLNLDKRTCGIRMALGASFGFIFLSALTENMMCFCIAYLLDIVMVHILKPTYPDGLTIILNARVYAAAFVFGVFMTLIVTWSSLYRLKKQKLVELFERVL